MKLFAALLAALIAIESFKPGILRYLFWAALLTLFKLATGDWNFSQIQ
jgi:hypothetical protein